MDDLGQREGRTFALRFDANHCLAPRFERCLLGLHESGGDESELREFDLAQGRFVPDGFAMPMSRTMAAWLDPDTLIVSHTLGGAPVARAGWPAQAVRWQRGSLIGAARPVLTLPPKHALMYPVTTSGNGMALLVQSIDFSTYVLHRVDRQGRTQRLPLPTSLRMAFPANATHVLVQTHAALRMQGRTLPADSVLAARLQARPGVPAWERVRSPKRGETFELGWLAAPTVVDGFSMSVRQGLAQSLVELRRGVTGWTSRSLMPAAPGIAVRAVGADRGGRAWVVARDGFLESPTQMLLDRGRLAQKIEQTRASFDASRLQVEVRTVKSKDGEPIDFFLVGPRNPKGPVPTLMTGYGAFGISMTPAYPSGALGQLIGGAITQQWFAHGGALAIPAIRGGGERGAAWHQAARRENRQRSYDDFHAVAQALIDSGYTARQHLGAFGLSNGGLLGREFIGCAGGVVVDVAGCRLGVEPLAHVALGAARAHSQFLGAQGSGAGQGLVQAELVPEADHHASVGAGDVVQGAADEGLEFGGIDRCSVHGAHSVVWNRPS